MPNGRGEASALLAVTADGIGDLTFASSDWVDAARQALTVITARRADALSPLGRLTLCEVAHNPPAYLRCGPSLAWRARFDGASVEVAAGELAAEACDLKVEGDHSILSNLARIQHQGRDPELVAAAEARLHKLSRWKIHGSPPRSPVHVAVLAEFHDIMALRTMPRFVFMTPEWVSVARHILSTRAESAKYAAGIADHQYTFSEEFIDTPGYAFPDGASGGFWARFDHGRVSVGAGALPRPLEPADSLTKGAYSPVVPIGRTVNADLSEDDKVEVETYRKIAFRFDKVAGKPPVAMSSPSGRGPMPPELGRVFLPLHDELAKRTSGELPSDFDETIRPEWAAPQRFDRAADYDKSWVRYDRVDIYGNPRRL